jgi:hypothetical protein
VRLSLQDEDDEESEEESEDEDDNKPDPQDNVDSDDETVEYPQLNYFGKNLEILRLGGQKQFLNLKEIKSEMKRMVMEKSS